MTVDELIQQLQEIKQARGDYAGDLMVRPMRSPGNYSRSVTVSSLGDGGEVVLVDLNLVR